MNKKQIIGLILLVATVAFDLLAWISVSVHGNNTAGIICFCLATVCLLFGGVLFVRGKKERDG